MLKNRLLFLLKMVLSHILILKCILLFIFFFNNLVDKSYDNSSLSFHAIMIFEAPLNQIALLKMIILGSSASIICPPNEMGIHMFSWTGKIADLCFI